MKAHRGAATTQKLSRCEGFKFLHLRLENSVGTQEFGGLTGVLKGAGDLVSSYG